MKALLLRREPCAHSNKAEAFLRLRCQSVAVVASSGPGFELDESLLDDPPDLLVAFRSHVIVRPSFLERIPLCLNFHPGPPERRGTGCVNFALLAEDTAYGATCHRMAQEIDAGPIVDVRRFPIGKLDTIESVLSRTYDYMLCQFYDVVEAVAAGRDPGLSGDVWQGKATRAAEMERLREIGLEPGSREALERQVRATSFGSYQPHVTLHGRRFVLETGD
jgi:methionyl-tRNA formyltransferase